MSDRSSESSGEWIVLNEDEEGLILDNNEQSLNMELKYDGFCHAVPDSFRSSFSSEELEWQYEQYEDYMPHRPSFVQEIHSQNIDNIDDYQSEDSNVEGDVVDKSISTIDEETNVDITSISKIHSYKHKRNDHLNFILNFTLALVLASAVGLGIGHFLGWSHKCFKNTPVTYKAGDTIESPHAVVFEQTSEVIDQLKNDNNLPLLSDNALDSVSCTNLKTEDSSTPHHISGAFMNSNIAISSDLTETSVFMNSDLLELKSQEDISQNNFSNPHAPSFTSVSDALYIDWNELSNIEAAVKKINSLKEASSGNIDINSLIDDEVNNIELELLPKNNIKVAASDENDVEDSEIPLLVDKNDDLYLRNKLNFNEFEFMKENLNEEKKSNDGDNLTNQLRKDLNEVVQSLAAIALARLSETDEKYHVSVEKYGSVIKLFSDFQNLINTRIADIDNFVSVEYKKDPKFNLKYLQKMVYTLIDSIDHLMKVSFKTLNNEGKKINVHKFSNNISKVIFNFNKKWEKNNRVWFQPSEKFKVKNVREGYLKKGKENKYLKNKAQFDKYNKKNYKNRRFSMKS